MTPQEMNAVLSAHDARAEPIVPEGWSVPNGYILRGPRGTKCVASVDSDGNVDDFRINLWLDGLSYGTNKTK